ncbi:preprotein translocase subunit SecG [Desulfogranum marinum]|uniref:preprotein translocase subunit SecG n=1 Tax=Desulfogranum marinum TaxID=453220 RepID=UPI0019665514|nr:preprotein translocase subunit SecG [Desulfogranum marinum]MBM9513601.1 preprotein translocase subunit SecG [Desulfogranum marinum]
MTTILIIVHVVVCFFLIAIVLLQHGKGADIGATFGGSSQSLFGTEGPVPMLNKITTLAAIIFMATSVSLAYISVDKSTSSVMKNIAAPVQEKAEPLSTEQVTIPMPKAETGETAAPAE